MNDVRRFDASWHRPKSAAALGPCSQHGGDTCHLEPAASFYDRHHRRQSGCLLAVRELAARGEIAAPDWLTLYGSASASVITPPHHELSLQSDSSQPQTSSRGDQSGRQCCQRQLLAVLNARDCRLVQTGLLCSTLYVNQMEAA